MTRTTRTTRTTRGAKGSVLRRSVHGALACAPAGGGKATGITLRRQPGPKTRAGSLRSARVRDSDEFRVVPLHGWQGVGRCRRRARGSLWPAMPYGGVCPEQIFCEIIKIFFPCPSIFFFWRTFILWALERLAAPLPQAGPTGVPGLQATRAHPYPPGSALLAGGDARRR